MREKLIDLMRRGADIEFLCRGRMFTILAWLEDGISIGPQDSDEDDIFPDAETLLREYEIDGIPMERLLSEIFIKFSS